MTVLKSVLSALSFITAISAGPIASAQTPDPEPPPQCPEGHTCSEWPQPFENTKCIKDHTTGRIECLIYPRPGGGDGDQDQAPDP